MIPRANTLEKRQVLMSQKKIRVGVIGMGNIGGMHAGSIRRHPDCELAAFFDPNPQSMANARASFPDARACESPTDVLDTPGIKAVVIATPNNVHAEYTIAAARRGMHVLCEKPLAMNGRQARQMVAAIKGKRLVGMTNFSYRWVPSFRLARDLVRDGRFGKIHRLHIKYLQSWLRDPEGPLVWRNVKKLAGFGALGDLGSHMIDAARFVTGAEPRRVVGVHHVHVPFKVDPTTGKREEVTTDTDAQFMIDFGSFVGMFETSQVEPAHGNHFVVSLGAENGSCRLSSEDQDALEIALGDPYATHATWTTCLPRTVIPSDYRVGGGCIRDFVLAIQRKLRDYPSFADGSVVQEVLDGILRSSVTGRWEPV